MKKIIAIVTLLAVGYFVWASPIAGKWLYATATDIEASAFGFEQRRIDIGELSLETYIGGPKDKPTIVMIHGFSANKDVWPRFAKYFVDDYQVVIPDLAGHGETGFNLNWDYSGPAQAERVAALLDKLGIEKAHIIGNSMGGFITAWFARLYPERTLTAAPMDPAGLDFPELSTMHKMIAEQGKNPFFAYTPEDFYFFYGLTMRKPPFLPPSVLAAQAEHYIARREELRLIDDAFYGHNWLTDELQHIKTPTLVMWGDGDEILHVSAAPIWHEKLPNSQLHIFKGIGHMPMVEIPEETAAVYSAFLQSAATLSGP